MNGARVCDPQQLRQTERAQTELRRLEARTLLRVTDPRSVHWQALTFFRVLSSSFRAFKMSLLTSAATRFSRAAF